MGMNGKNYFGVADMYVDLFAYLQNTGFPLDITLNTTGGESVVHGDVANLINHNLSPDKETIISCSNVDLIQINIGTHPATENMSTSDYDVFQYFHHLPQFVGLLGHNLNSLDLEVIVSGDNNGMAYDDYALQEYMPSFDKLSTDIGQYNCTTTYQDIGNRVTATPHSDGFSLFPTIPYLKRTNSTIVIQRSGSGKINGDVKLGGLFAGCLFQLGHPDLRMTHTLDTSGADKFVGIGGHRFTNSRWTQRPLWFGEYVPFEKKTDDLTGQVDNKFRRIGKKSWNVQLSYFTHEEAFGGSDSTNSTSNGSLTDLFNNNNHSDLIPDVLGRNMDKSKSGNFFTGINMTLGHLPFIFNPNSNMPSNSNYYNKYPAAANKVPQFIKAYFDQNSFQYTQVAPDLWNTKLQITESF